MESAGWELPSLAQVWAVARKSLALLLACWGVSFVLTLITLSQIGNPFAVVAHKTLSGSLRPLLLSVLLMLLSTYLICVAYSRILALEREEPLAGAQVWERGWRAVPLAVSALLLIGIGGTPLVIAAALLLSAPMGIRAPGFLLLALIWIYWLGRTALALPLSAADLPSSETPIRSSLRITQPHWLGLALAKCTIVLALWGSMAMLGLGPRVGLACYAAASFGVFGFTCAFFGVACNNAMASLPPEKADVAVRGSGERWWSLIKILAAAAMLPFAITILVMVLLAMAASLHLLPQRTRGLPSGSAIVQPAPAQTPSPVHP